MLKIAFFIVCLLGNTWPCVYNVSSECNSHGKCTKSRTCLCDLYYYGDSCESVLAENNRVKIVETGISQSDLAGIILGWIFGLLFLIGLSVLAFYYCGKQRRPPIAGDYFLGGSDNQNPGANYPGADQNSHYPIQIGSTEMQHEMAIQNMGQSQGNGIRIREENVERHSMGNSSGQVNEDSMKEVPQNFLSTNRNARVLKGGQCYNNYVAVTIENNGQESTPFSDELIAKASHFMPYKIEPITNLEYPGFFGIVAKNPKILLDLQTYIEKKFEELQGLQRNKRRAKVDKK